MNKIAITISILLIIGIGLLVALPRLQTKQAPVMSGIQTETASTSSTPAVSGTSSQTSASRETIKPQPTPAPTPAPAPQDTTVYYTSAQVALHNNEQSCWTIINGKVYDVTSWISRHPGGSSAIKRLCGVDGSENFNDQHGGQSRPESELASFFIGVHK